MITIPVTYEIPKESKEMVDACTSILADVLAGKKLEAITGNIDKLMQAAEGYQKLKEEITGTGRNEVSAYLIREFWEVFDKNAVDQSEL